MALDPYIVKNIWEPCAKEFYRQQFHEMILMDKAHGIMLVKQELLRAEDYRTIAGGLDRVEETLKEEDIRGELNDLYFNLTQQLYETIGEETGCLVHVGRSRNDMECTCNRMQVRREILDILQQMNEVMETLLKLADENVDTVITLFTFGQPAQPGTFAHYLMLIFDLLSRDYVRLQAAYQNANRSPMGAAAGIGTGFPLDPQYISDLLGFDSVIDNTIDAIASPDYLLETEADIAIMASNLSKIAQDLFFWASYEYRILDCSSSIATSSSIMPQKKNPTCFERMRAQSGRATGMLAEALALNRNTTLFPNMESTIDMFYVFGSAVRETRTALGLLKVGLENSAIRKEVSYEYTRNNFTGATTMAEYLSQQYHIPFTETHHIIHDMVCRLMENGTLEAGYLTGSLMAEISEKVLGKAIIMTDEEVQRMVDPMFCLERKVTGGTPKPRDTRKLIAKNKELLARQKQWLEDASSKILHAYGQIQKGI